MGTGCTSQLPKQTLKKPRTGKLPTAELTETPLEVFLADSTTSRPKIVNSTLQKLEGKKKEVATVNEIYDDRKPRFETAECLNEKETAAEDIDLVLESDIRTVQDFMAEFESVKKGFNDKKIKVVRAVGEKAITPEELESIEANKRERKVNADKMLLRRNLHRTVFQGQKSFPVYDMDVKTKEPAWNIKDKDDKAIRQVQLKRLVAFTNKLIMKQRAAKRLNKIRDFAKFALMHEQQTQIIQSNLKQDRYAELQRAAEFKFDLSEIALIQQNFPSQCKNSIQKYNIHFVDVPIVWSEDLLNLNEIKRNDIEVEYYENVDPFKDYLYKPVVDALCFKRGAEDEYLAPLELNNVNQLQKEIEGKEVKDIADAYAEVKDSNTEEFFVELEQQRQQSITESEENEVERYDNVLDKTEMDYYRVFDNRLINYPDPSLMNQFDDMETLKREYIASTNGYNFMKFFLPMQVEKYHYFVKKYNRQDDIWGNYDIDRYCPESIKSIELDDKKYIDEIELNYEKLREEQSGAKKEATKGLKKDKSAKKVAEFTYEALTADEKAQIISKANINQEDFDTRLYNDKKRNILSTATRNSDFNRYIEDPKNKLLI